MRCIMADVELRDTVEVLDPLVGPIVCQLRCSVDFVSLPQIPYLSVFVFFLLHYLTHLWHYDGLVASDYDHISFLLKWMEQCDSTGLSMLRMLLGFCPTYFHWVVTTCHIWHMVMPSNTCFRQEGHWVVSEVCFNSISSTWPISQIARRDSSLNIIPSFAKSLRIEILFDPAFTLFTCWLFCFILQDCVLRNSLYSEINVKVRLLFNSLAPDLAQVSLSYFQYQVV